MQDTQVKVPAYQLMAISILYRSLMKIGKQLAKTQELVLCFTAHRK